MQSSTNNRDIEVLCEMQALMSRIGFSSKVNLPTIIVIGSQSSGKSSVLENIAGRDFLPRGQGIVTRRPTIIQRIVDPSQTQDFAIVPLNDGNAERFVDFERLRAYLENKMAEAARSPEGIIKEPIVVRLICRSGYSLAMIDMPGLTKIALQGQHPNFPHLIEEVNRTYAQNPNSILLAISPANADIANSDSLRFAKEFDPEGNRTIGVFTKMDLMEDPTNIKKSFEGRSYPLKLGYYGLICRSQDDINNRIPVPTALAKESKIFSSNALFAPYTEFCGMPNLLFKLNRVLLSKMKETLPHVRQQIEGELRNKEAFGASFKKITELNKTGSHAAMIMTVISTYNQNFTSALRGGQGSVKITDKIYGGAKINLIFENDFQRRLYGINPLEGSKDEEIYWTIKNSSGIQQTAGFSNEAFETLAKKQTALLKPAVFECLTQVHEEVKSISSDILQSMREAQMFDRLPKEIMMVTDEVLQPHYVNTKNALETYMKIQIGCVNQKSHAFTAIKNQILDGKVNLVGQHKAGGFFDMFRTSKQDPVSTSPEVLRMKNLLTAYNTHIKDQIYDYIPKAIISMYINEFLVNSDTEIMQRITARGNDKALASIDPSKLQLLQNSEQEVEALRKTMALLEKYN